METAILEGGTDIELEIKEMFEQANGDIDVLYSTSDGKVFFSPITAIAHIRDNKLLDESFKTWTKDGDEKALRDTASQLKDNRLQMMIFATDFVKAARMRHKTEPEYQEYLDFCAKGYYKPVTEHSFDFIVERVFFFSNKLPLVGTEIPILLQNEGVVVGIAIRTYGYHKLALYNDYIILTCPTNIELRSYSIQTLFNPILGTPKK